MQEIQIQLHIKVTKISPKAIIETNEKNVFVQMTLLEARRLALQLLMVADIAEQKNYTKISQRIYLEPQKRSGLYQCDLAVTEQENQ